MQACGDAHLANFGLFASPERRLVFDINDFDETLPGPWEWDVKRLATSLEIAARDNGFSDEGIDAASSLATVAAYRKAMRSSPSMPALEVWYAHADATEIQARLARRARARPVARSSSAALGEGAARRTTSARSTASPGWWTVKPRIIAEPPLIVPLR